MDFAINTQGNTTTLETVDDNGSFFDNCSYADFTATDKTTNSLFYAAYVIHAFGPPVVLVVGIPGNILTIIVILRQRRNMTSTPVYLFMLAISDLVFLLFGTMIDWLDTVADLNLREYNSIFCKFFNLMYYWSAQFSSWLLVAITIERIISITLPHKYRQLCTRNTSFVCGICICCVLFILNIHFLYGFVVPGLFYGTDYGDSCGPVDVTGYLKFYFDIWPWVDFTVLFAIPFVVLCVGNSIILYKLYKIHAARRSKTQNVDKYNKNMRSITLLIVSLNVVFLICITPLSFFLTSENALYEWSDGVLCVDKEEYYYRNGVATLIIAVVINLSYLNPAINFILYVFSGTKFRNEIKTLLSCKPVGLENAFS